MIINKIVLVLVFLFILINPSYGGLNNTISSTYQINNKNSGESIYEVGVNITNVTNLSFGTGVFASSLVIDTNNIIYVGNDDNKLYSIYSNNLSVKCSFLTLDNIRNTPVIDDNGIIYFGSEDEKIYSVYPDCTEKWNYSASDVITTSSIKLDNDGNLYVINNLQLRSLNSSDGSLNWLKDFGNGFINDLSVSIDNDNSIIYAISYDGIYSYYFNGSLKWSFDTVGGGDITTSPSITNDYNIFVGDELGKIYLIYFNGTENYNISIPQFNYYNSISIDNDNDKFYVSNYNYGSSRIYSYNISDGSLNWFISGLVGLFHNDIIIDNVGNIIFADSENKMYAYNINGSELWNISISPFIYSTPLLLNDGYLYIVDNSENKIYKYLTSPVSGDTFSLSGNIQFIDIDNSNTDLENAYIEINDTLNDFTDSNGDYEIIDIPFGTYPLTITYSLGTETITDSIISLSGDLVENYNIEYSKPFMGLSYVEGNLIKVKYSHNYDTLNLWENPNYVWGVYYYDEYVNTSSDRNYYKQCSYLSNNIFACDLIPEKSYTFHIQYSDIYNYNLSSFHPSYTGIRNFTNDNIYIQNGSTTDIENIFDRISLQSHEDREKYLKDYLYNIIFWMICIILFLGVITFNRMG